jgi:hypothetical protein
VEGHSDEDAVLPGTNVGREERTYINNWDLAGARSINSTVYMINVGKLPPGLFQAVSYGSARPFAVAWAAKKHGISTTEGQRGLTFKSTDKKAIEAAQKAVTRVLEVCFPSVDVPSGESKAPAKPKADAVQREAQRILKNFTPAQRRKLIELLSA